MPGEGGHPLAQPIATTGGPRLKSPPPSATRHGRTKQSKAARFLYEVNPYLLWLE
jgi:hypothetical protein